MEINSTMCHYHPDKIAVIICERCRRPICVDDERTYQIRSGRTNSINGQYTQRVITRIYCILCYASQLHSNANPVVYIIFNIILMAFFSSFLIGPLRNLNISEINAQLIFVTIFFIGLPVMAFLGLSALLWSFYIANKKKANIAETQALNFKTSLYSNSKNDSVPAFNYHKSSIKDPSFTNPFDNKNPDEIKKSITLFSIICYECGSAIDLKDKFCPNCGISTQEELKNYYKIKK